MCSGKAGIKISLGLPVFIVNLLFLFNIPSPCPLPEGEGTWKVEPVTIHRKFEAISDK
jgi:hypothetical protein